MCTHLLPLILLSFICCDLEGIPQVDSRLQTEEEATIFALSLALLAVSRHLSALKFGCPAAV